MRAQYHLRRTDTGIDAWNVRRLIALSRDLPVKMVNPHAFAELHENHWYFHDNDIEPTPSSMIEHMRLIIDADLDYPIILDQAGRVMDGMHRICKAVLHDIKQIPAVRFPVDPEPDYVDCDPTELPYDD